MQIKAMKTERQLVSEAIKNTRSALPISRPQVSMDKAESLAWLQRLWAVQEYRDRGSSEFLSAEATSMGLGIEETIDRYFARMKFIKNPLFSVLTDDLSNIDSYMLVDSLE